MKRKNYGYCITLWLAVHVCLFNACAKVGDPVPPQASFPDTIYDLTAQQVGNQIQLIFSVPKNEFQQIEIYRLCDPKLDFEDHANLVENVTYKDLIPYQNADQFLYQGLLIADQACRYGLRLLDWQGNRSSFSKPVQFQPIYPAEPPIQLVYQVNQDRIIIRWNPPAKNIDGSRPAHIEGYLVNSQHTVSTPEYIDLEFQFGEMQSYRVQTISRSRKPLALSKFSTILTLIPKDTFPPSVPKNPTILIVEGEVQLAWDNNNEKDLKGYFVYRGTEPNRLEKSSPLITINTHMVWDSFSPLDKATTAGQTFYYRVAAVDQTGNESPQSETVNITVR